MSAPCQIRDLVRHRLVGRKIDPVGFMDELLELADQVGEIQCNLAGEQGLRFLIANQPPPFEVELDASRGKLRMLCARLGVLCHEAGDQEVSLYGGEGTIKKDAPVELTEKNGRSLEPSSRSTTGTSLIPPPLSKEWKVRFTNTPSEQDFTIMPTKR